MNSNLHIFNDSLGFFTNKTVDFIEKIHANNSINAYLNTAINCKNKIDLITYSKFKDFLSELKNPPDKVIFHSYNYTNQIQLEQIKRKFNNADIKFVWIFWSHEYYQLPEFFSDLYQGFSKKFFWRKLISFHITYFLQFFKGEVKWPFYFGLQTFERSFGDFNAMAALIKGDYDNVMRNNSKVKYDFVSYISISDFPELKIDLDILKEEVMIGHSGSPILNHYEIIEELSGKNFDKNIFVPLSYGKASYSKKLWEAVDKKFFNLSITFQTDYLSKNEYYERINNVGYFILNSYCQQALGNIFFFLWTGTKVYLRKNTSTFKTLKERGFHIFSIEDDFIGQELTPLTKVQKKHNHHLTNEMIGKDQVRKSWLNLIEG